MEISDIRVKLIHQSKERLRAVCSVTFDDAFVVRDVKVVDGTSGTFVAMPSRKLSGHCPKCRHKNQIRARFCNECGGKLPPPRPPEDTNGRSRYHRDIAHPINTEFREMIQAKVLEAFQQELAANPEAPEGEPERNDRSDHDEPVEKPRREEPVVADRMEEPAFEESEENFNKAEPVGEKSEYDSLIAGLNPGGPPRPRNTGRNERPAPSGDRDRGSSERNDKGRERGSRGGRRGRSENREERPAEKVEKKATPPPPAPRPVERAPEKTVAAVTDDCEDTQFGAEILIETKTPKKVIPASKPKPVQEVVESAKVDDDGGFGAGLI
jgi:stage V sporulation protein G